MKRTAKILAAAGLAAGWLAGTAAGIEFRSSYPLEAPEALKIVEGAKRCLPGRGGPGSDPNAARVEIRAVWRGLGKVPLATNGVSDNDANPLLAVTRIGAGVSGGQPGRFSVCVPSRALTNAIPLGEGNGGDDNYQGFFARVYDAPTVEGAKYYIDSDVAYYNPAQLYTNLVFSQKSMTPIAGGSVEDQDTDGDGLNDQDEALIGTDYTKADTDGDGLDDWVEFMYGLDPLSHPVFTAITGERTEPAVSAGVPDESLMHVEWPATTDSHVRYTLEFVGDVRDWPENGGSTNYVWPIDAGSISKTNWAHDITRQLTNFQSGFFRLRLDLDRSDETPEGETGGESGE
jgi:hypothetical protein